MKHDWTLWQTDSRGWTAYKCSRCGKRIALQPYPLERIVDGWRCRGRVRFTDVGTILAVILTIFGVTKHRVNGLRRWLGLKKSCRCPNRESYLNRVMTTLGYVVKRVCFGRLPRERATGPRPRRRW